MIEGIERELREKLTGRRINPDLARGTSSWSKRPLTGSLSIHYPYANMHKYTLQCNVYCF